MELEKNTLVSERQKAESISDGRGFMVCFCFLEKSIFYSQLKTILKSLRKGTTKSFQRPFMSSSQALLTKKADSFILGNIKLAGKFGFFLT